MPNNTTVNKVVYGTTTIIDLTADDVAASDVRSGKTFHLASGATATGTAVMTYDSSTEELTLPGWAVTLTDG